MCTQSIPELISFVVNEIPIDTTTVYIEAMETRELVVSAVLKIETLVGNAFLLSNGHTSKPPSSLALDDRAKDILYVKFVCHFDAGVR